MDFTKLLLYANTNKLLMYNVHDELQFEKHSLSILLVYLDLNHSFQDDFFFKHKITKYLLL